MQIIGNYPAIVALEEGQALEKSRCFGQTGRAGGKNSDKIFRKPCFEGLSSRTFCLLFGLKK
jgi:hypothetical protein